MGRGPAGSGWIPALGSNRNVQFFPCNRAAPPANHMYRRRCAGASNMYLMGDAYAIAWWKAPSMTLQTCVGADSKYRLMVRLVEVTD